ncbi:MAG TPA: hypothetical protein VK395_26715 [Gemmataceae bacterium]|nr:hypothetical protein [Gemmataceae bacterium]
MSSELTTKLSSGGRAENRDVTRDQNRGRHLLQRLDRRLPLAARD